MCNMLHTYAPQKTLAIAQTPAVLDSVVEVRIGKRKSTSSRWVSDIKFHPYSVVLTLVKVIPAMPQLHTVHLDHVILPRVYLYTILSSPHLVHLSLDTVQMPKMSKFPPPKLRKLTLTAMTSWDAIKPLISHLSTSLEHLEVRWCDIWDLHNRQLPPIPCLRELRHLHITDRWNLADGSGFFHLGPHISHLHLSGNVYQPWVVPFPKSLRHLFVDERVLTATVFGTNPLPWLTSLSIRCDREREGVTDRLTLLSFVCVRFPRITSLHLTIPWHLRHFALVMARSQPNVQALNLVIDTLSGLDSDERGERFIHDQIEVPNNYLHEAVLPAAIHSLSLEVVQTSYKLERSIACCTRWIDDNIIHCVTGLGGPYLKSIDVVFIGREDGSELDRVLRMRWVKSFNGSWQTEKCL